MNPITPIRAVQHYIGKFRTMRQEIRTVRFLNSLPSDLRKDIGWPDACEFPGAPRRRR
ncbi:MAG TPA: hypothetical protein VMF90_19085 [Rhizobiaceae bacterium]|nr:hypothetical protein [Rhizobiaceae bacterium]